MTYRTLTTGLLLSSVALCGVSFSADAMNLSNPTFNVGATVGGLYRTAHPSFTVSDGTAANTASNTQHITDSGMLYGILAGADWYYNRIMFGLGANLDWDTADREHNFTLRTAAPLTFSDAHVRYDRGVTVGFSGRLGYKVTDYAMPYLRLGVQSSRDTLSYRANQVAGPAVGVYDLSTSKRVTNAVYGVGLEIPAFICNSALRFEYDYIGSDDMNLVAPLSTAAARTTSVAYKPTEHQAKVSWVWNFH